MSIKRNFYYNSILTVAGYIFPLLVFPYISRVLGVEKVGIVNFVDSIVNYYILFSALGISSIGIREIAKCKNEEEIQTVFSSLLTLNVIGTFIVSIIFVFAIFLIPELSLHKDLLWVGFAKLIFSMFLIEWFFQGIQNFKYITFRTILVRIIFVISVFLFVKNEADYTKYYILLTLTVVCNALINIIYSRKYVFFSIEKINIRLFFKSYISFGLNNILVSLYTTFNVVFLGFVSSTIAVGYYTTATKLYFIIMAFFSALTGSIIPKISKMISEKKNNEIKILVLKVIDLLLIVSFPIIFFCEIYASEIIGMIAGNGFDGAILPFRIVILLIFIIGIEQIFNQQLLMSLNNSRAIIVTTLIGAIFGVTFNLILVPKLAAVGSSLTWMFTELVTLGCASFFVYKELKIKIPFKMMFSCFIFSLPYLMLNILIKNIINDITISLLIATLLNIIYFLLLHILIRRNSTIFEVISKIINLLPVKKS